MNKLVISMSLGLLALLIASPAFAQSNTGSGGYMIDKKKLDKVKPYNAPRQIDILDERPIIHNHLTAEQEPDTLEINAGFPAALPGRHIVIGSPNSGGGAAPFRTGNPNLNSLSGLAPASDMHRSNISSKPPVNTGSLPGGGQSIGVHAPTGEAAMGKRVSGRMNTPGQIVAASAGPIIARGYKDYSQGGSNAGRIERTGTVSGRLAPGTLTKRLFQN